MNEIEEIDGIEAIKRKNKRLIIISVSVALLIVVLVIITVTMFGKKPTKFDTDTTATPKETTTIVFTTDEAGNQYVTNINGDLIPVTTNKNGFMETLEDLIHKTPEQVESEKEEQSREDATSNTTKPNDGGTTKPAGAMEVGNGDDANKDAVIKWN